MTSLVSCSLTFSAHYGLFGVLLTMSALLAALALVGSVGVLYCQPDELKAFALWTGPFSGATLITHLRCRKRSEDFARSVFDLFLAGPGGRAATERTA